MSDTAAFFAKKKTKKKKFKSFNANKIDASAVTSTTHVDAPEISAEDVTTSLGGIALGGGGATGATAAASSGDDQWADNQTSWGSNNKTATTTTSGDNKVAELLDMRALSAHRNAQDDVAERLRIEETKAKLAAAKEGMAKEAERLAAEKAEKEAKAAARAAGTSTGSSGLGGGGAGGKWVPAHMRNAGGSSGIGSRYGMGSSSRGPASMDGSGFQKPVDMANEELFPDLAEADKILEEKEQREKEEQERIAKSQAVRAPAGWGSRMGPPGAGSAAPAERKPLNLSKPAERKPLNLAPATKKTEEEQPEAAAPKKEEEEKTEEAKPETTTEAPAAETTPAPAAAEKPKEKKVLKKKKKKDLSTFKPKS